MNPLLWTAIILLGVAVLLGIVYVWRSQRALALKEAAVQTEPDDVHDSEKMKRHAKRSDWQARTAAALSLVLLIASIASAMVAWGATDDVDVCANIEGIQTEAPEGMVTDDDGNCTETEGNGNEAPFDPANVCPNGVDDSENFVIEASEELFLWQAHGSLEGRSGEAIVGAYYGDPGYSCFQAAQEGKNVAVLYAEVLGARNFKDVNAQLVEVIRDDPSQHRQSAELTSVVMQSFFDNAVFKLEEPDDGTWTIATVSLDGQQVVEVVDVPIREPIPAYCGLRPATSLDDPSAESEHADEAICYLVTHGVWAYESQLDHIPDMEGAFELGAEVVEETTDTTVLAAPEPSEEDEATSPPPTGEDEKEQPSKDKTEDTKSPGSGGGDADDSSGDPGKGGSCDGEPSCEGEDPGSGGSGGDDCKKKDCGGGGTTPTTCPSCGTTTTTVPATTTTTVKKTTTTTTAPTTTTTRPTTTTTVPATTTTTVKKTTTTTTAPTTTTTRPTTTTTSSTTTTTVPTTIKGPDPCEGLPPWQECNP